MRDGAPRLCTMVENAKLVDRLKKYVLMEAPQYALLIEGAWGSGKTHFVLSQTTPFQGDEHIHQLGRTAKRLVRTGKPRLNSSSVHPIVDASAIYVSLNGCPDPGDFQTRLFVARFPIVSKGGVSSIARQLGKHFLGLDPRIYAVRDESLYIFDDVERCEMPMRQTLGLINELVEHRNCRVVLLCNPDGLQTNAREAWVTEFEKVIGLRYVFSPDIKAAYQSFVEDIEDDSIRSVLNSRGLQKRLFQIFRAVGQGNLRAVIRTTALLRDLIAALSEEHLEYSEAIIDMVSYVFAYSIGVRSNMISDQDLRQMVESGRHFVFSGDADGPVQEFYRCLEAERLQDQSFFSPQIMYELLRLDYVDAEAIRMSLEGHARFLRSKARPSWQVVWFATENSNEKFNAAVLDMRNKWATRAYVDPGEILHVSMLNYWLAEQRLIDADKTKIDQELVAYLQDLEAGKKLVLNKPLSLFATRELFPTFGLVPFGERGNMPFFNKVDPPLIQEVRTKIERSLQETENGMRALWGDEALEQLIDDGNLFIEMVGFNSKGEGGVLCSTPIFSIQHVDTFITQLEKVDAAKRGDILYSLAQRYRGSALTSHPAWQEEEGFLKKLYQSLQIKAEECEGISAVRWRELAGAISNVLPAPP